jgi:hypothetical protein
MLGITLPVFGWQSSLELQYDQASHETCSSLQISYHCSTCCAQQAVSCPDAQHWCVAEALSSNQPLKATMTSVSVGRDQILDITSFSTRLQAQVAQQVCF